MSDTSGIRGNLVGGGVVTLGMVVVLIGATGVPTGAADLLPVVWFTVGGVLLLAAGRLDRFPLGVTSVGWPRTAAVGLAILAAGSSALGFLQLMIGTDGWDFVQAGMSLVLSLFLAIGALECWHGGIALDEDAFVE
ncbi:hypothetical protein ACLI4Z_01285 [Natrialbaceae archaeon A-arb3/5]